MVSPFLFFFPCFHMIQSELAFLPVCSSLQTFHILRNLSCTEKHFRCTSVVASSDLLSQYCGDFGYYFFFFFLYFLILSLPLPSPFIFFLHLYILFSIYPFYIVFKLLDRCFTEELLDPLCASTSLWISTAEDFSFLMI